MLRVDDIHVFRGRTYVLKGTSLQVDKGEIVALIGANGAGKTTMLRTISGLLHPKRGAIFYTSPQGDRELEISSLPAEKIAALGMAHCPEGRGIFSGLSVTENLMLGAYLRRDKPDIAADYDAVCAMFPILAERSRQAAGSLSGGEQEMLAIGRALMSRPTLLILDEPSLGLAPLVVEQLFDKLADINLRGVTILLVEQNAVMALQLSHRAYVLETGNIYLSGRSADLANDNAVRQAYLGGV